MKGPGSGRTLWRQLAMLLPGRSTLAAVARLLRQASDLLEEVVSQDSSELTTSGGPPAHWLERIRLADQRLLDLQTWSAPRKPAPSPKPDMPIWTPPAYTWVEPSFQPKRFVDSASRTTPPEAAWSTRPADIQASTPDDRASRNSGTTQPLPPGSSNSIMEALPDRPAPPEDDQVHVEPPAGETQKITEVTTYPEPVLDTSDTQHQAPVVAIGETSIEAPPPPVNSEAKTEPASRPRQVVPEPVSDPFMREVEKPIWPAPARPRIETVIEPKNQEAQKNWQERLKPIPKIGSVQETSFEVPTDELQHPTLQRPAPIRICANIPPVENARPRRPAEDSGSTARPQAWPDLPVAAEPPEALNLDEFLLRVRRWQRLEAEQRGS